MKDYYSVGEAAKMVRVTGETLRHYDRIGLIQPSMRDPWTGYRYYTEADIVRLHTIRALQQMDLPLREIKRVLEYDDLEKTVAFLEEAERRADAKIAALQFSKSKIQLARASYAKKLELRQHPAETCIRHFPQRTILLSDTAEIPTLDVLWNYLGRFYEKIEPSQREQFDFEDSAGIYTEGGQSRMFAVCTRYETVDGLKILPGGDYLCADCSEESRAETLDTLLLLAAKRRHTPPEFALQMVVVSGILHWNYQIQIPLDEN